MLKDLTNTEDINMRISLSARRRPAAIAWKWVIFALENLKCFFLQTSTPMSGHAMSQQSCSFTKSNWSWDLLIDLICMQRETSGSNRGEKVNGMLIFYPSEFASSCGHCTLTICRSYKNHMTHNYCKGSSSLSGCGDVIKMYFKVNL